MYVLTCFTRAFTSVQTAFSTLYRRGQQVILAGDHKQLGPVVRSSVAGQYGLQLVDCRSRQYEKNAASKNGKGAVGGECEEE